MKKPATIFAGVTCIATDIALMQILYTTISYAGRGNKAWPGLLIWLISGSLCYLVNLAVLKKSASVPALTIMNIALLAALLYAMIRSASGLVGFFNYAFLALFSIITVAESVRWAISPVSPNKQLRRFDAQILAMLWLFLNYAAGMPRIDLPLMMVVLILNVICNITLRAAERDVGGMLCGSPIAGPLLYCGLAGGGAALVYFIVRFLSTGSQEIVSAIISAAKAAVLSLFGAIGRFFSWLVSLLPYQEQEITEMDMAPPPPIVGGDDLGDVAVPPILKYIVFGAIAIIAIIVFAYFIYRMRGRRIKLKTHISEPDAKLRREKSDRAFRRRILAIIRELKFLITAILRRSTSPGTLVYLERWGKKHNCARGLGESMREYLYRLSPTGGFSLLALDLDSIYFGGKRQTLSKSDCRNLRRKFHRHK